MKRTIFLSLMVLSAAQAMESDEASAFRRVFASELHARVTQLRLLLWQVEYGYFGDDCRDKLSVAVKRMQKELVLHVDDIATKSVSFEVGQRYLRELKRKDAQVRAITGKDCALYVSLLKGKIDELRDACRTHDELFRQQELAKTVNDIRALCQAGANPNEVDSYKKTPLMLAVSYGFAPIVDVLLKNGADPMARDTHGCSVFDYVKNYIKNAYTRGDYSYAGTDEWRCVESLRNHLSFTPDSVKALWRKQLPLKKHDKHRFLLPVRERMSFEEVGDKA